MPLLTIRTNIHIEDSNRQAFIRQASTLVANELSKSEKYVMINLQHQQKLLFAGSDKPCALLELKSIGLPEDRTAQLSSALCEHVTEQTGIPSDRVYIEFTNAARHMWGWNGSTF